MEIKIPWSDFIYYDPTSKSHLRYKVTKGTNARIDSEVGSLNKGRYSFIFSYLGTKKRRYVHRVIWELFNGTIPEKLTIDHIDGNAINNNIDNLRMVTVGVNSKNRKMNSRNKSGISGIVLKYTKGYYYFIAYYQDINSNTVFKNFSCLKLGFELARAAAISFRENGLIADGNYTERHGKKE